MQSLLQICVFDRDGVRHGVDAKDLNLAPVGGEDLADLLSGVECAIDLEARTGHAVVGADLQYLDAVARGEAQRLLLGTRSAGATVPIRSTLTQQAVM